ncbi:MAG: hypothetical protein ACRBCL_07865 [Maritimibacter sp.]
MWRALILTSLLALGGPAVAQDADFELGGDQYAVGRSVTLSEQGINSAFIAGNTVTLRSDIDGSAHMAGRSVTVMGRVGENLYGAGMTVDVSGAVSGDATLLGDTVMVSEPVSGNLRATAGTISIDAPVAGSAILAGETVTLNEAIVGDVALASQDVTWGDKAVIEGTLHIYSDSPDDIEVPTRVIDEARIERHSAQAFDEVHGTMEEAKKPSAWAKLKGFIGGILVTGLLATLIAVVAPKQVASLRARSLEKPGFGVWMGAIGFATLIGLNVVLMMTGIGIVALFVTIPVTIAVGFLGYLLGVYMVGVWALGTAGRAMPETTSDRAVAGFAGAAILTIIAMIPLVGWWIAMAAMFLGLGGVAIKVLRSKAFAGAKA